MQCRAIRIQIIDIEVHTTLSNSQGMKMSRSEGMAMQIEYEKILEDPGKFFSPRDGLTETIDLERID